jgi:UDP-glucose 4-epimerase
VTTALVTGGAGFIGSHLVDALTAADLRVRVLDDFSTGKRENLGSSSRRIELVEGSVTDPAVIKDAMVGVDCVFHLAALASVQRSVEDPARTHEVCATGTLRVLDAARQAGVRRVVYAASSSAYGDASGAIRREDDPLVPLSPYAAAKLAGEHYCQAFTITYGLETVRLRFFNIFGPRQDASSPYSGVIALFVEAMSASRAPTIFGDGQQSRDFTYVSDAVQALVHASEPRAAVGNVYNFGTGVGTNLLQLVEHLNRLLGTKIVAKHGPERIGDVRHSQADISRARRDLGYEPRVSFEEGLRLTLESHRQVSLRPLVGL